MISTVKNIRKVMEVYWKVISKRWTVIILESAMMTVFIFSLVVFCILQISCNNLNKSYFYLSF